MTFFSKLLALVFLAVVYVSSSMALINPGHSKHTTHGVVSNFGRGVKIEPFHPSSTYQVRRSRLSWSACRILIFLQIFGAGVDHPLSKCAQPSLENSTVSFVKAQLKVDASTIRFRNSFLADTAHHAYVNQVHVRTTDTAFPDLGLTY